MTTQEMIFDQRRKAARKVIAGILMYCKKYNSGHPSAISDYNVIRETLIRYRIVMRTAHAGHNIVSFTLYDGEELDSTVVETENKNRWLTLHQLFKKYDGQPCAVEILNMNAERLYYTDDVINIYENISIELLLSHVFDYKEINGCLTIILES